MPQIQLEDVPFDLTASDEGVVLKYDSLGTSAGRTTSLSICRTASVGAGDKPPFQVTFPIIKETQKNQVGFIKNHAPMIAEKSLLPLWAGCGL